MPERSKGTVCKTVFRGFESHSRFYTNLIAYGLRRELSKRKWISRAKKVYNACGKFYVPVAGIKANVRYNVPIIRNKALKVCESITDFLDSSKYAKMLKNCTSPYRSRMMQYEYKKENRNKAKRDIQEGIQEYESRDNLSCSSCIFYDKGFCEKGLLMTAQNIGIKDKYINGSLVKRVLVFKTRKHPDWVHYVNDSCFGKYIEIIGTHVLELIRKKK